MEPDKPSLRDEEKPSNPGIIEAGYMEEIQWEETKANLKLSLYAPFPAIAFPLLEVPALPAVSMRIKQSALVLAGTIKKEEYSLAPGAL